MDEKQRKILLMIGLAAVLAVWKMRSTVDGMLMKPIRDLQIKLNTAKSENESLSQQKLRLTVAQRNLEDWRNISLPQDIDDAQRLYREWIYELTRQSGFTGPGFEVTTGTRSAQKEYSTVNVEVKKAETDLQGLTRFLYLFDNANILHRISAMKIDSPGAQGNPKLSVSFTAEGMSVVGSEVGRELLPRTTLSEKVSDKATDIIVASNEVFPTWDPFEPFLVRIDRELLLVESVSEGGWKVKRGAVDTKPALHDAKAIVELLPVAWDRKGKTLEQYAAFVSASVFVIPAPPKTWNPRLAGIADKTIKPGEEVKFTVRAESLNPELGEALFALSDAAEGMSLDPTTGEFTWQPAADLAHGKYSALVILTQLGNPDLLLESDLAITIKSPNSPPQLTLPESAIAIIGREFAATATATDDNPEKLRFSLGSGGPEGLTIDPASGQLKWTPARTFTPGSYEVEVKVTDSGEEPQTASARMNLDVQDDNAALTLLSGAVAKDDVWFAWFRNNGTGKTDRLKAGDQLNVSEISAEIVSITSRFVTLRDEDGLWKLALGDGLRDRKLIEPTPRTENPKSEGPEPVVPKPEVPKPEVPKPDVPEPDVPKPDVPEPDVPEPDVPKPDVPEPDVPETDVPETDVPKPDVPEPDVPKPDVPEPDVPETDVPKPDVPKPDVPETDVPEPDVPEPDVPETVVPEPVAQKPEVPETEAPTDTAKPGTAPG